MTTFMNRLIIGIALLLANLLAIFSGSRLMLLLFTIVMSSLAIYELENCLDQNRKKEDRILLQLFNILVQFLAFKEFFVQLLAAYICFFILLLSLMVFDKERDLRESLISIFISIYLSFFASIILLFPASDVNMLLLVLSISWGTDTFAYLGGRLFGKTPLSEISPNKTVEGSVTGIIGSVLTCLFFRWTLLSWISLVHTVILALVGSVISQIGDLFASRLKRSMHIKDYSSILKSHGGIMDRYDSVFFALPTVWLFYYFIF